MTIRKERPEDAAAITRVVEAAFHSHPYSNQTEHILVERLRSAEALSISLVAVLDGAVVGHIAFSPVTIDGKPCRWFGLAPVSVEPDHQGEGIGSMLIRAGLAQLERLGCDGCVLLGEPAYYGRFGFKVRDGLTLPGVPPEYFLALPFRAEEAAGEVAYHDAFEVCG
ncbi:GNAT family N-acetyltransferase [Geomonas oryzae]|nr:N-acetyltransferase [Geomonas oryzae]